MTFSIHRPLTLFLSAQNPLPQDNETTVQDNDHDLILYTINPRVKCSEGVEGYLTLPSVKSQLQPGLQNYRVKMTADFTVSNKVGQIAIAVTVSCLFKAILVEMDYLKI